jgi:hypothetical protein
MIFTYIIFTLLASILFGVWSHDSYSNKSILYKLFAIKFIEFIFGVISLAIASILILIIINILNINGFALEYYPLIILLVPLPLYIGRKFSFYLETNTNHSLN